MKNSDQKASTYFQLEAYLEKFTQQICYLYESLRKTRSAAIPGHVFSAIAQLKDTVPEVQKLVQINEEERQNFRVLSQIGQVVNSSLDVDVVLQIVMDTIIRLTGAERGFLMLRDDNGELIIKIARNWEQESLDPKETAVSRTVVNKVVSEGNPILTTNAQEDPRFSSQDSIVALNLRSILCVPLKLKEEVTGVMYADNRIRSGLFTTKDLDLLVSFTNQAAVALENARLFASVRQTLAEVTELKNLMDNVFASITSGVLTADDMDRITLCNRAAEQILGRAAKELVGLNIEHALSQIAPFLEPYLDQVIKTEQYITDVEGSPILPERGKVDLRFSLSPLKDFQENIQGVAIVLEDLTEKRKLEAQHRLFERMVSPAVIEQINPNMIQLGGVRTEITVLFADIRGYTTFSEGTDPEELVRVLNRYLAVAVDAILSEGGTIDKFMGDAVMAWFNAPLPQPDHALRAVRAAQRMQDSLHLIHRDVPQNFQLQFGVGLHTGEAVLGLVGTEQRMEFTAIGDTVNTAKRIQENCEPGWILISSSTLEKAGNDIFVVSHDPIIAKGKRDPLEVFQVSGIRLGAKNI